LTLTLYWSARTRPSADYTVFVHLLDGSGHLVAQADSPPQHGRYPTSFWDAGDTIVDPHDLALDPSLPPGKYSIEIGLYRPENGQRLALEDGSAHPTGDHLVLPEISVQ
jgi:hypothetical protein